MSKNVVAVKQTCAIICKELEGFSEEDRLRINKFAAIISVDAYRSKNSLLLKSGAP